MNAKVKAVFSTISSKLKCALVATGEFLLKVKTKVVGLLKKDKNQFSPEELHKHGRVSMRRKHKLNAASPMDYILAILIGLIVLAPFYILIITSLMTEQESNYAEFHWWPQMGATLKSYYEVLFTSTGDASVLSGLMNTFLIYIPAVTVGILSSAMAAYAFAKIRFRASKFMFSVLMFTMMFPNVMNMVASFLIFDTIGWINTPLPLMIPEMLGNVSAMFFFRQYFLSVPDVMISAAKVDGAGQFRIFTQIALPIAKPVLLAQWIFRFMAGYNDYMNPLIYLQDARMYTVQLSLAFFVDPYTQNWPLRMAGVVVSLIPMLIIYAFAQKYITQGMAITSGLKD